MVILIDIHTHSCQRHTFFSLGGYILLRCRSFSNRTCHLLAMSLLQPVTAARNTVSRNCTRCITEILLTRLIFFVSKTNALFISLQMFYNSTTPGLVISKGDVLVNIEFVTQLLLVYFMNCTLTAHQKIKVTHQENCPPPKQNKTKPSKIKNKNHQVLHVTLSTKEKPYHLVTEKVSTKDTMASTKPQISSMKDQISSTKCQISSTKQPNIIHPGTNTSHQGPNITHQGQNIIHQVLNITHQRPNTIHQGPKISTKVLNSSPKDQTSPTNE